MARSSTFSPASWWQGHGHVAAALAFAIAALAIRAVQFGNPVVQVDEQFYLLVGDRMLHGALPYTDIWDRKPVGLFLIYAGIRLLGGEGIWQYQLVATGCAAATAFLVRCVALRIAPPPGAFSAGLLYLIYLMANGGDGGQAPVFYNLLTAAAALAIMRVIERPTFDRAAFGYGCATMALIGVALQMKYTVLFEGVYFGLALLVIAWRKGMRLPSLALAATIWIGLALLPTVCAILSYAWMGHLDDFLFANFESIFLRPRSVDGDALPRLGLIAIHTAPLLVAAAVGCAFSGRASDGARFITGWAIVAVAGLIAFGTYHAHYALPLLVPLAVAAAALPGRRHGRGAMAAVVVLGVGIAVLTLRHNRTERGTGAAIRLMTSYIRARPAATVFVFNGDPILYHLTGAALPTRWSFPTLLSEKREIGSSGTDQLGEIARVMSHRPRFVVTRDYPFSQASPAAWDFMAAILKRDYAPVLVLPVSRHQLLLYERRPAVVAVRD